MTTQDNIDRTYLRAASAHNVDPRRLRDFIESSGDPDWKTDEAARQIAKRMAEGLINQWRTK